MGAHIPLSRSLFVKSENSSLIIFRSDSSTEGSTQGYMYFYFVKYASNLKRTSERKVLRRIIYGTCSTRKEKGSS
jgi:hypothetical protein